MAWWFVLFAWEKETMAFQSRQKIFSCEVKIARKARPAKEKIVSAFSFFAL